MSSEYEPLLAILFRMARAQVQLGAPAAATSHLENPEARQSHQKSRCFKICIQMSWSCQVAVATFLADPDRSYGTTMPSHALLLACWTAFNPKESWHRSIIAQPRMRSNVCAHPLHSGGGQILDRAPIVLKHALDHQTK